MSTEFLLLLLLSLFPLWIWIERPIARAARRQLRAEIADLREQIRRCDQALLAPATSEGAKQEAQAVRDQCHRSLLYLETRVKVIA